MIGKFNFNKYPLLLKICGILLAGSSFWIIITSPESNFVNFLLRLFLFALGLLLTFYNTQNKSINLKLLSFVLIASAILGFVMFRFNFNNLKSNKILSISLSEKCEANIDLSSGKTEKINVSNNVENKKCPVKPVVSKDGKYTAFDLELLVIDPKSKNKKYDNNSTFLYIADLGQWIVAYNHGAGKTTKLSFDQNNNLIIDVTYEGNILKPYVVNEVDFLKIYENEKKQALDSVNAQKEVKNWLSNFKGQNYTNVKNNSRAIIMADRYEGSQIIIHAYEQFLSDGHTATFNWYNYDRLTNEITKDFK